MPSTTQTAAEFDIETLISKAGGIDNLRVRMGLDERKGYNLICTWRSRGAVPTAAQVEHRNLFLRLMRRPGEKRATVGAT